MSSLLTNASMLLLILALWYQWHNKSRISDGKPQYFHHEYVLHLMSNETRLRLQKHFEAIHFSQVQSNWSAEHYNDIGEAEEVNSNGQCDNPYLVLNEHRKKCMLPVRMDVAKHYIQSGGYHGFKESASKLISRMVYFIEYSFNATNLQEFDEIFASDTFVENAKRVCLAENQHRTENVYLRRFQANFILQIPGQNIPMHYDVPFFYGASRYVYPKWLLVVMERSGLFKDRRIPQVQIVTYIHDNNDTDRANRGGEFILYDHGNQHEPTIVRSFSNSAVFADGSLAAHTTSTLYPKRPNLPLMFGKDELIELRFDDEEKVWKLYDRQSGEQIYKEEKYSWNDVRASIAWRAWCFDNESQANAYDPYAIEPGFDLPDILLILKKDLAKRWRWSLSKVEQMQPIDLALALMDEYVQYPYSQTALMPFNYCAVFRLLTAKFPSWKATFLSMEQFIRC